VRVHHSGSNAPNPVGVYPAVAGRQTEMPPDRPQPQQARRWLAFCSTCTMPIHAALHHVTRYRYDRAVNLGPQVIRLRPAPHTRSRVISYSLQVEPSTHFINWLQDPMGNYQARLVFPEKATELKVTVDLVVEMGVYNPFDFFLEPWAEQFPFAYPADLARDLAPYLEKQPAGPLLERYLRQFEGQRGASVDFIVAMNQTVQRDVSYLIRMEPGVQTPEQTLQKASGSCRDSAWLLVQILRHCGLAARFVSGYLIQLKPDAKPLEGPVGAAADFTDLHAWCEVFLPGAGWVGLDPTSGLLAGEGHIPLASTASPISAAPIEGLVDEAQVEFAHDMQVTRVLESPRVTKPYTEQEWARIVASGDQVDQRLTAGDVRLTMGGEPTFVAEADRDAPEWNTEAMGPTKRQYGLALLERLAQRYAQGAFIHLGQGKWYPGEQLPRWALSVYWRTDGEPCWGDFSRFDNERNPGINTPADAAHFIERLCDHLGLVRDFIEPGYEDAWYYLWRERRLPVNVDPFRSNLDDPLERERLRRVFAQGLDQPVGYALPLQARDTEEGALRWQTGPWFLRDERLYLLPGDSPMGYRLPMDSLPWVDAADYPYVVQPDPFAPVQPLPEGLPAGWPQARQSTQPRAATRRASHQPDSGTDPGQGRRAGASQGVLQGLQPTDIHDALPGPQQSAHWITRTALCVEVRDPARSAGVVGGSAEARLPGRSPSRGVLHVFMPPLARLEEYLQLLGAIEKTACELGQRIVLEGYPPPKDPRLTVLQITPDPGVLEVNIHPSRNWPELVERTEFLYEAAFRSGLSAEKFLIDGRHTGTGGGNHVVLGAATAAESPFFRRPDLLASLILYWHNHPSLSYLFSGLFIGPTSQAPRVDEARNDQLYELEIALRELRKSRHRREADISPWLIDRTLRNLLIDVTGNTHRSEFCIDKLYSPESASGRLGLVELRALEMPPHARMSVVQQLLLRALVARFWETPCELPVTRWGTELHDRFMLPHFVWADFADVIEEMNSAGFDLRLEWFAPHFEFRFPLAGELNTLATTVQLRHALEPWHVMGEEGSPGGTVRYVDASLERLQVLVRGLNASRHTVTVNGRPLPLQPTGVVGEYVAGVRFRAWAPASALHPSIGVHAPLTFDLVDTWMQRSMGGCQYHVAHPGGRNYASPPVNAYEAESRRLARFFTLGHTAGRMAEVVPAHGIAASKEFPFTLDLRR
jgi:uncharacterized protein (DUF2126 family)